MVIPVFNRAWAVRRAVSSAVNFLGGNGPVEIVLVDDASTDNSLQVIQDCIEHYRNDRSILFKLIRHETNKGVCAAKNSGAAAASGEWLVFLDSDDELLHGTASYMRNCLLAHESYPLHFFKCVAETEAAPETPSFGAGLRDFRKYFLYGTDGEALPVIRRDVFLLFPYDVDINGYESLAYLRIVRKFGAAVLNSLAVRRYYTSHDTRLSSKAGMAKRYRNLAKGHLRVLQEHGGILGAKAYTRQLARYVKSIALAQIS